MAGILLRPKRRTGATGWPAVDTLAEGEMVVNSFDQKIGMRVGPNIVEVANAAQSGGGGDGGETTHIILNGNNTLGEIHLNAMLEKTLNGAVTWAIPPQLGVAPDAILIVNGSASGSLTLSRGSGVSLWTYGTNANLVIPVRRSALLIAATAANTWIRA